MKKATNAEIIAIGTEILLGEITDTNSVFIARALRDIGVNVFFMTSVGDNEGRIADAIRTALARAEVVITCGGLGPTVDDMTRQGVAAATDRGLTFHQPLLDQIAARFSGFRTKMSENNRRQAYAPDDAIIIENPVGTAPSFIVEVGDQCVISLPGVPREMKYLLIESVVPYLRQKYALEGSIIKARLLKVAGLGESVLDEMIGSDLLSAGNPTVGLAAHSGQIDVRITAKADSETEADRLIEQVESQLRTRIGDYVFGIDTDTIERALVDLIAERAHALTIVEAGIEPALSGRVGSVADSADVVQTVQSYADPAALGAALDVPELPLRRLAERAAEHFRPNGGVCMVVVAHPNMADDQADSREGSAVAVYANGVIRSRSYGFGGASDTARAWTGTWGMSTLWRLLREQHDAP